LIDASAQGWTQLSPFPGTARDDAASFAIGEKVYVGTGRDVNFALRADWFVFDMIEQNWEPIAELPASGRQYCSTFTDGVYGYLFGGVDDSSPLNELWRYDPMVDTWQQMSSLPGTARWASVSFDDGMVCTGLFEGGIPTNECWHYDVATNTWSQRADLPGVGRHRAAGSGANTMVIGGMDPDGNVLNDVLQYDSSSDTWASVPITLPAERFGGDAVFEPIQGTTYFLAGASSNNTFHDDMWMFNGGGWEFLPPFPGGDRRGGVIATGAPYPNAQYIYYGTGVDDVQRYGDWWVYVNLSESIREHPSARLRVYPEPSQGIIWMDLPQEWSMVPYRITDTAGRPTAQGTILAGEALDMSGHAPGRYIITLDMKGDLRHGHFTIIPQ